MKVLIAEDEEMIQVLIEQLLETRGCEVVLASTGEEAIRVVGEQHIDAIFMDIMMPNKDGIEALQEIRNLEPNILVVMMSGFALEEKVDEAKSLGAFDFMYKPFRMADIATILDKVEAQLKSPG